jgi:hypothetical protein
MAVVEYVVHVREDGMMMMMMMCCVCRRVVVVGPNRSHCQERSTFNRDQSPN